MRPEAVAQSADFSQLLVHSQELMAQTGFQTNDGLVVEAAAAPQEGATPTRLIAGPGRSSAERVKNLYRPYRFADTPQSTRLTHGKTTRTTRSWLAPQIAARDSTDAPMVHLYYSVVRAWAGYCGFGI